MKSVKRACPGKLLKKFKATADVWLHSPANHAHFDPGDMVSGNFNLSKNFQRESTTYFWSVNIFVPYFAWEKHGLVDGLLIMVSGYTM